MFTLGHTINNGRKFKPIHKKRIALALMGNKNGSGQFGEKHGLWKGDKAGYSSVHSWIRRNFGQPQKCVECGRIGMSVNGKWNIQWTNISGTYVRDRNDWIPMCPPCHSEVDQKSDKMKLIWQKRKQKSQ